MPESSHGLEVTVETLEEYEDYDDTIHPLDLQMTRTELLVYKDEDSPNYVIPFEHIESVEFEPTEMDEGAFSIDEHLEDPYECDACDAAWNAAEMGTACPYCEEEGIER